MTLHLFSVLGVILLVLGFVITYWLAVAEDTRMRQDLLTQAKMVAATISPNKLKGFHGLHSDIELPVYQEVKQSITRHRSANLLYRFIYIAGIRADGTVFFFVDSESPESEDYSPPGQIYEEVGEEFRGIFQTGKEVVEGPTSDRWGTWISALVPIVDPQSKELVGVLGLDIDAEDWSLKIISRCAPAISLTLLLGALLIFFYILFQNEEKARKELAASESRLAESERAYRSVVMNMLDIFFRVDTGGAISMLSPSATTILGYQSIDELLGENIRVFWIDRQSLDELREEVKRSGAIRDREVRLKHKEGHELDFSITVNMIFDESATPIGYEGIARDISERNKAERKRQELEKQIQRAQKMEAMGTLAGGVAHDLNNILSGIVSYPDMMLLQIPDDSPLRGPLEIIRDSGMKASIIVNDLLTLARRGVTVSEVIDINELVIDYLRSPEYLKLLSFNAGISVKTELEDGLMSVLGSPVHLSKVLMNLVTNAVESMPEGGTITIKTRNCYVDYPIKLYERVHEGEYVALSVIDNGVGVSEEDQARIFEPFFTSKQMGRSGTGLGMAVIWGSVKDHQGYVDIKSTVGHGSTFTIYLPITRKKRPRHEKGFAIEKIRGNGEKILVIDDIQEQRQLAMAILSQLDYAVEAVSSGEEAIRYLETGTADLILLDMVMSPGMDGLETYRQILADAPGQRAIICSGYSENDRIKKAQLLGAGRYLKKPYTFEGLGVAVQEELMV